jgi:hypothetical protein
MPKFLAVVQQTLARMNISRNQPDPIASIRPWVTVLVGRTHQGLGLNFGTLLGLHQIPSVFDTLHSTYLVQQLTVRVLESLGWESTMAEEDCGFESIFD